jgi:16S rRNA (cytosine967-C5)-methyltransferase
VSQAALLTSAAEVVTLGGRIVYATCSSEPEENEQVVEKFLANTPGFTIERPIVSPLRDLVGSDGYFRTLPYRDELEGFFAVVLRRNGAGRTNLQ